MPGFSLPEDLVNDARQEQWAEVEAILRRTWTGPARASEAAARAACILRSRYGEAPQTARQIAGHLTISAERVRQIEHDALRDLRWEGRPFGFAPHGSALHAALLGCDADQPCRLEPAL